MGRCAAPSAAARRFAPPLRGATRPARCARSHFWNTKKKPHFQFTSGCLLMHPRRRPCGRRKKVSRDRAQTDFGPSRVRVDRDPCFSLRTSIGGTCCITRYAPSRTKATHATTSRRLQHRARATSRSRSSCRCTCVSRLLRTVLGQGAGGPRLLTGLVSYLLTYFSCYARTTLR